LTIAERITQQIADWPEVTVHAHGPRFVEFRAGRRELGHLHGSHLADITFPVRIREELVAAHRAMPHHHLPQSGWVSVPIRAETDVEEIVSLFRLSYERPWLSRPEVARSAGGR
jgi:predicted DNA-binding protein (MmcQ/YjbR family)